MTIAGWLQITLLVVIVGLMVRPLGGYLARVYAGERTFLQPILQPIETSLYRVAGIEPSVEQSWYRYAVSFLVFHAIAVAAL
jgi:potassium-transporting ATPase potassium-binding subunit